MGALGSPRESSVKLGGGPDEGEFTRKRDVCENAWDGMQVGALGRFW